MKAAMLVGAALLALAGCERREAAPVEAKPVEAPAPSASAAPAAPMPATPAYPSVEPRPPGSPGALPDDRTPISEAPFTPESAQGGADVVQRWFAFLESGRAGEGAALWSDPAAARAFAARVAARDSFHALIGAPGRVEGAAGSSYLEVPVQAYGRAKDGAEVHEFGKATLRRVNDVPGATPEQLKWRIVSVDLKPAP